MLPQTRTKRALQRMAKRLGIFVVVVVGVVVFACTLERDNGAVVFRFLVCFLRSYREGRRYSFYCLFVCLFVVVLFCFVNLSVCFFIFIFLFVCFVYVW